MKCVLFAIVYNQSVFLQKRDNKRDIKYPNYWALFGGAVEGDETIIDALRREFFEEIEICDENNELVAEYVGAIKNEWDYYEYIFIIQLDNPKSIKCLEGKEGIFYDINCLPQKIPPHHIQALDIIGKKIQKNFLLHINLKECFKMKKNVNDFVTVGKLGVVKDTLSLEKNGKGYLIKKEGALTALYHNGEGMRFLGYIEFKPQKTRGDHYHKEKVENMCVISGTIRAKYLLPDEPQNILEIDLVPGDVVHILPGCAHSYLSDTGAVALEFSPQNFRISDTIDFDFDWS